MDQAQERRRARAHRRPPTAGSGEGTPVPFASVPSQRELRDHELLGLPPTDASPLQVLQGYQRALRAAQSAERHRQVVEAFRHLGPQPIRTVCPWGHSLTLYAIDGASYQAHCPTCHAAADRDARYGYVGWAKCSQVRRGEPYPPDLSTLPPGAEEAPLRDVEVRYDSPEGQRALVMSISAGLEMRLQEGDVFSVLYRGDEPWRLLNHTSAESFPLDPHFLHRGDIEELARQTRERARLRHEA